jgi:hypothetical protein
MTDLPAGSDVGGAIVFLSAWIESTSLNRSTPMKAKSPSNVVPLPKRVSTSGAAEHENSRGKLDKIPLVQNGPVPTYFVTGLGCIDLNGEYGSFTYVADQCWGGQRAVEREITCRVVMPRSAFEAMYDSIGKLIGRLEDEGDVS